MPCITFDTHFIGTATLPDISLQRAFLTDTADAFNLPGREWNTHRGW